MARCIWRSDHSDLNGYVDYMAKVIDEEPVAAARVIDELVGGVADGTLWGDLGLAPFDRLEVIGCGTSLNAGRVIGNVVRRLGAIPVYCTVVSEAADEIAEPHTLCLPISQRHAHA
ncbi:MAG: glucosamine--fructose-6-phosphate aminotransferase, isomerizing [Mycobacterium sp.]|nr:glucosamine--fructose-6-phosphate aminotransferase, isomerizing [Mycobacterium sp.]